MAYCVQCGNRVGAPDRFCGKCGAPQVGTPPRSAPATDFVAGISNRNASLLCYIPMVGWIAAIVVLASERFRRETQVRFHAFQGLYIFVAWLMVEWVVSPVFSISEYGFDWEFHRLPVRALQLIILAAWVIMIVKVSQDDHYKLPIFGDLAERSVSEQRS